MTLLTWIRAIETIVEYKPEMTHKMAADLSPWWVWYWASMYISATNLGPFSKEMLIHTSPVSAPSQGQNWLHQSFAAEASPHKGRFVTVVTVIESFFLCFIFSLIMWNIYSTSPLSLILFHRVFIFKTLGEPHSFSVDTCSADHRFLTLSFLALSRAFRINKLSVKSLDPAFLLNVVKITFVNMMSVCIRGSS